MINLHQKDYTSAWHRLVQRIRTVNENEFINLIVISLAIRYHSVLMSCCFGIFALFRKQQQSC